MSAPGHKTVRYWLTFDRPTKLVAQLVKGTGSFEATEEQTLIALGEISAPAPAFEETPKPAAKTVAAATPAPAPATPAVKEQPAPATVAAAMPAPRPMTGEPAHVAPRKIGRAAADAMPPEISSAEPVAEDPAPEAPAEPKPAAADPKPAPVEPVVEPEVAKVEPAPAPVPAVVKPEPPRPAFDKAVVSAVVGQNRPAVMKCFADGKKANPKMKGKLSVHLAVDAAGKVKQVQVSSTLGNPLVAACVAKLVNGWKFPARATDQLAMVSYPFTIN